MAQSTLSVRIDANDKKMFDQFCNEIGLTTSGVINMFVKKVIRDKRIPFDITAYPYVSLEEGWDAFLKLRKQAEENGLQDMTQDEINKIIQETRARKKGKN